MEYIATYYIFSKLSIQSGQHLNLVPVGVEPPYLCWESQKTSEQKPNFML